MAHPSRFANTSGRLPNRPERIHGPLGIHTRRSRAVRRSRKKSHIRPNPWALAHRRASRRRPAPVPRPTVTKPGTHTPTDPLHPPRRSKQPRRDPFGPGRLVHPGPAQKHRPRAQTARRAAPKTRPYTRHTRTHTHAAARGDPGTKNLRLHARFHEHPPSRARPAPAPPPRAPRLCTHARLYAVRLLRRLQRPARTLRLGGCAAILAVWTAARWTGSTARPAPGGGGVLRGRCAYRLLTLGGAAGRVGGVCVAAVWMAGVSQGVPRLAGAARGQ